MSDRVRQMAGDARVQAAEDPARQQLVEQLRLDDPVAAQTEWVPSVEGGANFCTRKLVHVASGRVEFRPTVMSRVFPVVFLLIGLGAPAFIVYGLAPEFEAGQLIIVPIAAGCLFAVLGGTLYRFITRRAVFDQRVGCFWMGSSTPRSAADTASRNNAVPLAKIHAIQLISKSLEESDDGSLFTCYEINLVVNDGTRINVVSHSHLVCIQREARQLAQFLNVRIWDAT